MQIEKRPFGLLPTGQQVELYTLCAGEMRLCISTLGATWTSLQLPGGVDVLLGCGDFSGYVNNRWYFGATLGRFANRINGARFALDGKEYRLSANKPDCSLHGGQMGFSRKLWHSEPYTADGGAYVRFALTSPDGDQGYPGKLSAEAVYGLTDKNELIAEYRAEVDCACPVNLTNHAYFNLAGENSGKSVLDHELKLNCSAFVAVDDDLLPTGALASVDGSALDFRQGKKIGRDFADLQATKIGGIDHCFAVDGRRDTLRPAVELREPESGRSLSIQTTLPGIQVYTANMLPEMTGKIGSVYRPYSALCLEPQYFPDSPNHPSFPNAVFGPERQYFGKTVYTFAW